jgi:hypothetical protein
MDVNYYIRSKLYPEPATAGHFMNIIITSILFVLVIFQLLFLSLYLLTYSNGIFAA